MSEENILYRTLFGLKRQNFEDSDTTADMYKQLISIAWPAALEGLLLTLMNSFDTMMVGQIGPAAIASVGLCSQPRMIMLLVAQALCVGTTAVVARRKGEGRQDLALSCLKQSLVIITFIGIAITLCGFFGARWLVLLAGASEETVGNAVIYFQTISLAFVFNCWALCICAAMRGIGRTKVTMTVNMTANVVNVFLNYCLILGHFGFPALGVRGAAIATAIGTLVSCIMAVRVVLKKGDYLSLRPFTKFSFDRATVNSLMQVGSGTIAESVFLRIGFLLNGRLIAGVGTSAYATNQIVQQISGLAFTVGDGTASACTSLVGQSLGAKKKEKAKMYVDVVRRLSLFLSIAIMLLTFFGRNIFPTFFTTDQTIITAASLCFLILMVGIIPQNLRVVLSGCLRGAGDVKFVAVVSLISVLIIRPLMTWLFCYPVNNMFPDMMFGFTGPWISFGIDALVRAAMLTVRVNKGEWVNIRL
ncbi:MAG TPA: MATE family efflux transporter [Erysipelotrichaceae bacterium]|nr:MATE family efflux transporter [Erysipelotrichaceae bacterium]